MTLDEPSAVGLERLDTDSHDWILLLDAQHRPIRWLDAGHLGESAHVSTDSGVEVRATVPASATLFDTLEQMLISSAGVGCVVEEDGSLRGIVELSHLNHVIRRVRREAREHYESLGAAS